MSHLLDSSAWLAHLFGEPGVEQVNQIFDDDDYDISISALSIVEVFARVRSIGHQEQWPEIWKLYSALFTAIIPADESIANQAVLLRAAVTGRLPTIDALIAATALTHGLVLVHRDPHMLIIPMSTLNQLTLPEK